MCNVQACVIMCISIQGDCLRGLVVCSTVCSGFQIAFGVVGFTVRDIHYSLDMVSHRAYFSVQLITICAVVKSKCAVEKGNECTKNCRDSGQNDDLCTDYQLSYFKKSYLKYALVRQM